MEEEKLNLSNDSDSTDFSTPIKFKKIYEFLNDKYETCSTKSICSDKEKKQVHSYFNYNFDNAKYFGNDINKNNIKRNAVEEQNIYLTDSNCVPYANTMNLVENNVPLSVLIKQMLDEAFGNPSNMTNVNEDPVDLQNTRDDQNDNSEELLKLILKNEDDIDLKTDTNNVLSSNETLLDSVKCDDNKLLSIAEETENSLSEYSTIENTGMHLNKLVKFNAKVNNEINNDNNIASLKENNDNSTTAVEVSKDILCSKILLNLDENEEKERDKSLYYRDFVEIKSLMVDQEMNIDNKIVTFENLIDSINNLSFEKDEDQTMHIFNISSDKNIVEKNKSFHEQSNLPKKEETKEIKEISSFDDNSIENKPTFVSEVNVNLQTPYKKRNQFITTYHIYLPKRKSELSTNTIPKLARNITVRKNNTVLTETQINHVYISSTNLANIPGKTRTSKIPISSLQNRAKLFKLRNINKKQHILIPEIMLTPATPK